MVLEADGQARWQKSDTEGHMLHYQTWVQTRRPVARGWGRMVMDDAGQSARFLLQGKSKPWPFTSGPGDVVNDAATRITVNALIVATPALGAWSPLSVFACCLS